METPIGNSTEKPTRVVSGYGATRPEAFHKCFIRQLEREIQRDPPRAPVETVTTKNLHSNKNPRKDNKNTCKVFQELLRINVC